MTDRVVILAAGKSTRLGGINKLLVKAGNDLVINWHRRALEGREVSAVVGLSDFHDVSDVATWFNYLIGHNRTDGPVGALNRYLWTDHSDEPLVVLYADTLLPSLPEVQGDWVGVAPAPWRVWDYQGRDGWTRGVPEVPVCVGVYRFTNIPELRHATDYLTETALGEVHMVDLLRMYEKKHPLRPVTVNGWQDAGDSEALARIALRGD